MPTKEDLLRAFGSFDLNGDGVMELIVSGYDDDIVSIYVRDTAGDRPEGLAKTRIPNGLENLPPAGAETGGTATSEPSVTPAPTEEVAPTDITVRVNYEGPEVGELVVAAFPSLPPVGPPAKFVSVEASSFPVEVSLEGLTLPNCQLLVFLDLEPFGLTFPSPTDPIAESAVLQLGAPLELDLTLVKP